MIQALHKFLQWSVIILDSNSIISVALLLTTESLHLHSKNKHSDDEQCVKSASSLARKFKQKSIWDSSNYQMTRLMKNKKVRTKCINFIISNYTTVIVN